MLQDRQGPVTLQAGFVSRRPLPTGFKQTLPDILVMMLMMNLLIFGGAGLAEERRSGVLRRMLMNPVRRRDLIAGKIGGLVLLGAVQALVFALLGQFGFGVDFGPSLPTTLATLVLYIWVAASLGVLIGGLVSREEKIVAMCPAVEMVRLACSGTESTMHAIRVARAYTGRELILKFVGNYHGFHCRSASGVRAVGSRRTPRTERSRWESAEPSAPGTRATIRTPPTRNRRCAIAWW